MQWHLTDNEHTYILRYYLPCLPQYPSDVTERRSDELVDYCKKHNIGAVMFYVDLNPYWYYMPDTQEHNSYVAEVVQKASQKLKEAGISYQLNYQNLFGSWDGNFDHKADLPYECYVDESGNESYGSGCMIGEKFRHFAGQKLLEWAKTMPDAIWIDDDMRTHNHQTEIHDLWDGKSSSAGLDFGCFCSEHIKRFNERMGYTFTREQLVKECLSNPEVRTRWLNFQNACLCDTASWIENIVHSVSPDTRVAIMTSLADVHAVEGRNWHDFLHSLSGDKVPLIRATFGPYCEASPRDFAHSFSRFASLKSNLQSQYKSEVDYCPEIENTRFTRYSKSIAATKFQLGLSAFMGARGVTLSIFDLEGCILNEEPEFGNMLDSTKMFCDTMNKEKMCEYTDLGVSFIASPDRVQSADFGSGISKFRDMVNFRDFDILFAKAGIPIKYTQPEDIGAEQLFALDRFAVKLLSEDELMNVLSKAVILEGGAADELIKRGFGQYVGIDAMTKNQCIVSSELLCAQKRSDNSDVYVPSRICGDKWYDVQGVGFESLSFFITPDGKKHPGFTKFKNSLGGKVIVYATEGDFGDGFYSNYRIRYLKQICKDLLTDITTVNFPSYGLCSVRTNGQKTMVFVANLSTDLCENLEVSTPQEAVSASVIFSDGNRVNIGIDDGFVKLPKELSIYEFAVIEYEVI